MECVTVGKIGTTWGTVHMGEWVRWENGLTKEKLTQMGRNGSRLKKEPRWEKMNTDKKKMNPDRKK